MEENEEPKEYRYPKKRPDTPYPKLAKRERDNNEEFLKVKEGESPMHYYNRTKKRYGLMGIEVEKPKMKTKRQVSKRRKVQNRYESKIGRIQRGEKKFNELKILTFVLEWASIKFDIKRAYLEFGFFFYDDIPFTRDTFRARSWLVNGGKYYFATFYKNGYVTRIHTAPRHGKKPTPYFVLSKQFSKVLTEIYKLVFAVDVNPNEGQPDNPIPQELKDLIREMNSEVIEIKEGLKPNEPITSENKENYNDL